MKYLSICILLLAAIAGGLYFAYTKGLIKLPEVGTVLVPVTVTKADNVGAMRIELVYDAAVGKAVSVDVAELAENAMMESNIGTAGRIVISLIDTEGITGSGPIATIRFERGAEKGGTPVTVREMEVYDVETRFELAPRTSVGTLPARGEEPQPVEILFGRH